MRGSDSHSCAIAQLKTHAVTLSSLSRQIIETSFDKVGLSFETVKKIPFFPIRNSSTSSHVHNPKSKIENESIDTENINKKNMNHSQEKTKPIEPAW